MALAESCSLMTMKNVYLERYAFPEQLLSIDPTANPGIIIVIPAFKEEDLISCLQSLYNCTPSLHLVEIIVVINQPQNVSEEITVINEGCFKEATEWAQTHKKENLSFHILFVKTLPPKDAGVGLARKIGMDEAVRRFESSGNKNGVIVCFDADCTCEKNYLLAIESFFRSSPSAPGASIYYEHPVSGNYPEEIIDGIIHYELFLRYYVDSLRLAGFPFAWQTVGSSMAVRSDIYQKQGGMNKKKAGEDFYFMNKIIPLGNFGEINETTVKPSPRISDRVPFGTGKTIGEWMNNKSRLHLVYNPLIFDEISSFINRKSQLFRANKPQVNAFMKSMPQAISNFLDKLDFVEVIYRINKNCSSSSSFESAFFRWFDAFRILKFVHFGRDHYYPQVEIASAACTTLNKAGIIKNEIMDLPQILEIYRDLDRNNYFRKFIKR